MISADDSEAIAAAFGLGEVLLFEGPCARGELGQVWRLSAGSGDWAVKESFEAGGVHDHAVTTEFHEAAVASGVPAPSVRRATDGSAAVLIGDTPVRVHGWVDLDPPDPAMDPVTVGAAIAALHRVVFSGDLPAHWWNSEPVGADGWDFLIGELRTRHSPLADRFARWRDEFVALESWLAPARAVQVCHRDLFADNLRRTTAGAPCIIDWDNAGDADPNQELAMVLFEFTSDDMATAPTLMTSYIEAGGPARVLGRQDFSMTIAVLGHLARRIGEMWLAPGVTAEERVRQERRFDEYDERPFTREVIDRLLDAIA